MTRGQNRATQLFAKKVLWFNARQKSTNSFLVAKGSYMYM
jgi:hypothetical protein